MAYPRFGIGRLGVAAIGRCGDTAGWSMLHKMKTAGGDRMRAKLSGLKHLLYTAAALATLALAAGARYKPH